MFVYTKAYWLKNPIQYVNLRFSVLYAYSFWKKLSKGSNTTWEWIFIKKTSKNKLNFSTQSKLKLNGSEIVLFTTISYKVTTNEKFPLMRYVWVVNY